MKQIKQQCEICGGTGIYVGFAEKDGFGIVCHKCKGKGFYMYTYEPFLKRKIRKGIKRVLKTNPGIGLGINDKVKETDFGGITYQEWLENKPFILGTEMRKFVCPLWWYQSANYKLKPKWDECIVCGSFSNCDNFKHKEKCWERFDNENKS